MTDSHLYSDKDVIKAELETYVTNIFGKVLTKKYFESVKTPMEEYTLHVFRQYDKIDTIVDNLIQEGFEAKIHEKFPNVIITTPKGPFKIQFESNMKEIIVDNKAAEMIYQGSDVFVPGVKRANKVKKGDVVKVMNQRGMSVSKAKAMMDHHDMLVQKKGIAARNMLSPFIVPNLSQLNLEDFPAYFQSLPAYLTSLNLEPKKDQTILDCCSAPGNKTLHLNELTQDKSKIIALDRSSRRLDKLRKKIRKHKIKNIIPKVGNIIELSKNWQVKFDKILIDPPCSSLGLRPRLVHDMDLKTIKSIADYQKAIFYACNELIKPNGEIVYSTCTITKEENEDIIENAIEKYNYVPSQLSFRYSKSTSLIRSFDYALQRFIPGVDKTLGFFFAKLQKK